MANLPDAEAFIADCLAGVADGRRYSGVAPKGTVEPYVIIQVQSPGSHLRTFGGGRIATDPLYIVKAVAKTKTWTTIAPTADAIDAALHNTNGVVADGTPISIVAEGPFSLIETDGEDQYRHLGGRYRVLIGAT